MNIRTLRLDVGFCMICYGRGIITIVIPDTPAPVVAVANCQCTTWKLWICPICRAPCEIYGRRILAGMPYRKIGAGLYFNADILIMRSLP